MARRYRKNSQGGGAAIIIAVVIVTSINSYLQELNEQHPYVAPLVVFVMSSVIILALYFKIYSFFKARRIQKAFTIADIDNLDGIAFEHYLAKLLKSRGFTGIKLTEKYDLGVDIIAKKGGITWGVQAKRYKNNVKAAAVRQTYTALNRYKCDRAMVITNSFYSRQAQLLANDNNCVLVGREELKKWVYEYSRS